MFMNRTNIFKMSVVFKMFYRFNEIPFKILASYFVNIKINDSTIYMEKQKIQNSYQNVEEQRWETGITLFQCLL